MRIENCKMKDYTSNYGVVLEIKCDAKTEQEAIEQIKKQSDFFYGMEEDEIIDFVESDWISLFDDGIVIWVDGE